MLNRVSNILYYSRNPKVNKPRLHRNYHNLMYSRCIYKLVSVSRFLIYANFRSNEFDRQIQIVALPFAVILINIFLL
jgi:hypothetical protein